MKFTIQFASVLSVFFLAFGGCLVMLGFMAFCVTLKGGLFAALVSSGLTLMGSYTLMERWRERLLDKAQERTLR
jgi:membrane protein implicated in regulation of membrane protease activity